MTSNLKCPYTEEELKEIRNNFKGDKLICPDMDNGVEVQQWKDILGNMSTRDLMISEATSKTQIKRIKRKFKSGEWG